MATFTARLSALSRYGERQAQIKSVRRLVDLSALERECHELHKAGHMDETALYKTLLGLAAIEAARTHKDGSPSRHSSSHSPSNSPSHSPSSSPSGAPSVGPGGRPLSPSSGYKLSMTQDEIIDYQLSLHNTSKPKATTIKPTTDKPMSASDLLAWQMAHSPATKFVP